MSSLSSGNWLISVAGKSEQISVPANPVFLRILCNLPAHVRTSLTAEQIAGIAKASNPPKAKHIVNYRASLPFFGKHFYLTLLMGREKRCVDRLGVEGQLRPWILSIAYFLIFWIVASMMAATGIVILYFIKSAAGIDLFTGPSVLHGLLFAT